LPVTVGKPPLPLLPPLSDFRQIFIGHLLPIESNGLPVKDSHLSFNVTLYHRLDITSFHNQPPVAVTQGFDAWSSVSVTVLSRAFVFRVTGGATAGVALRQFPAARSPATFAAVPSLAHSAI
jgi:hypothetical protein